MNRKELREVITVLTARQERERDEMLAEYSAVVPRLGDLYRRSCGAGFDALYADRKVEVLTERLFAGKAKDPLLRPEDFAGIISAFAVSVAAPAGSEDQRAFVEAAWRLDASAAVSARLLDEWTPEGWTLRLESIELAAKLRGVTKVEVANSDQRMCEVLRSAYTAERYREIAANRNAAATDPDRQIDDIFWPLYRGTMGLVGEGGALGRTPPDDFVRRSFEEELGSVLEAQRRVREQRLEREMMQVWPAPVMY
ncbi:hypothetical protein HY633_02265 [Candidatus Uhrbacteria bacterium]|nr:hypothetical protein [Candidatus Uhrbacteria bacterium]